MDPVNTLPLAGLRVVDFTTFLSGPFCTQILGDLGADIIKIESEDGDSSRAIPPYFVGPDSAYFFSCNRNKRSIALNLKHAEGLTTAKALIHASHVVVENFRPGVCQRLGLDVEELRKAKPDLIWASISGFGQTGPSRDKPAYDMIVQALSGVMSLTGEPGRNAVRLGIPAGDLVAGMYAVIAILAARTAQAGGAGGRVIDISMLDSQLTMVSYQAVYAMVAGITPQPQGARHDSIPTYRSFRAGDGREFVVTANTDRMWRDMVRVIGRPELADDPRFATGASRLTHRDALWEILEPAFLEKDAAHFVSRLSESGVPAALIRNVPEALDDAEKAGRFMVREAKGPAGERVKLVGSPMKFSESPEAPAAFPPRLGADNEACLSEVLGMKGDDIARLRASGALLR